MHTIQQVHDVLNDRLVIMGVVLTMYDARTNLGHQVVAEIQSYFPEEVFQTIVPRTVRLSEAPSYDQTILSYAPNSAGVHAYRALAQEFIRRVEE